MASGFPASSSSQQPFATPQPAPIPTTIQATSPPTKASLKGWWKSFRPPNKNQEPPGTSSQQHVPFCKPQFEPEAGLYTRQIVNGEEIRPVFKERNLVESASLDSVPGLEEVCHFGPLPSSSKDTPEHTPSLYLPTAPLPQSKRRSNTTQESCFTHEKGRKDSWSLPEDFCLQNMLDRSTTKLVADGNDSSDIEEDGGSLAKSISRRLSACLPFSLRRSNTGNYAKTKYPAPQPTGIFGVPLRQSIVYANVAISLVDGEGKSYIYGYVPIVVAKCGVYLKEKGTWFIFIAMIATCPNSFADSLLQPLMLRGFFD